MKPASRKNIDAVLSDVRHPKKSWKATSKALEREAKDFFKQPKQKELVIEMKPRHSLKKATIFSSLAALIILTVFSLYLWNFKNEAVASSLSIYENIKFAVLSLTDLKTDSAESSLNEAQAELDALQGKAGFLGILPILKQIPETIGQVNELTRRMSSINDKVSAMKVDGLKILFGGGDSNFVASVKSIREDVVYVDNSVADLRNKALKFGALPEDASQNYLLLNTRADRFINGLDGLIELLEKPGQTHLVLVFENPSEIRPAGGFVGSYADLILEDGVVKNIEVDDIYRPDRFLDLKIIPPKQLQSITSTWGARDANWFFNFPDSAEKTIEILQASSIYEDEKIVFEGVVAVNVRVMEDILRIIGPIEIDKYDLVLNEDNFLKEVQYEVEAGRDKIPGQNPKKVLKFILPKVLENIDNLDNGGKRVLADTLAYRLANKDIKFYFKDPRLQNIVSEFGLGGEVYKLSANWNGDYLGVVNTNVAGGKTDVFMSQNVQLVSKIGTDGTVTDNLTITRSHNGKNEKESWYRQLNQNFIKIFTPPGSKIIGLKGSSVKTIKPLVNYAKSGYVVDEDLASIENTEEVLKEFDAFSYVENNKKVFATWFNVKAGESRELHLTYVGQDKVNLVPGSTFEFVMDKQSGVESKFYYILEAPPGFKFRETGDFIYSYKSDSIPSRLSIKLTLDKM